MSLVVVPLTATPHTPAVVAEQDFDPAAFEAEVLADVDALAEGHKCNCAASDDNPY
jgi:hypothetical protein